MKTSTKLFMNIILLLLAGSTSSQNVGMGIETNVSGNGHGAYYSGFLSLNKGNNTVRLGGMVQQRSMNINGVRLSYSYKLAGLDYETSVASYDELPNGSLVLSTFSYVQYLNNARLSSRRSKVESLTHEEKSIDWDKIKLSTVEAGIGIELNVKLTDWLQLRNFLGCGVYYHINYVGGMYQERMGPILNFGTGINIPGF